LRGIVGFELAVDDIQVKFKLNQNHPAANIEGAIAGLRAQGGADALEVAALMREALDKRPRS
jgi:transcriptional regulator